MDITGGEPTIYPYIEEIVAYAKSKGVLSCIITNGIVTRSKAESILNAGLDGWLISRHGLKDTHNNVTNFSQAYDRQLEFLEFIKGKAQIRFNCVIHKFNELELDKIADELRPYCPEIVNFINMNPHTDWISQSLATKDVIANLNTVEPLLNASIAILEKSGIGVNVRYYPMCRIAEEYRRCICNDLQVLFDPYEWDYQIEPKTFQAYEAWGKNTSNCNEEKGDPCNHCDLQNICGGANKHWHKASKDIHGEVLKPQQLLTQGIKDFYYYRQHNTRTLKPRV